MSKTIEVLLSRSSIREAIQELEHYKREINFKIEEFARRLAEEGVIMAKAYIMSYPAVDTGELLNSITLEKGDVISDGATYYVYTGCEYAKYVEFGTGVIGEQNKHPNPSDWEYDVNNHGYDGWFYYKNGEVHWTMGMPARPFMYNTTVDLFSKVSKIAKEVFS